MAAELQEIHARSRGAWDLLCPGEPFPSLEGGGGDGTQVVAGEEDAVFEDGFLHWKEDLDDATPGKEKALFQLIEFFTWLETADEEDEAGEG